MVELSGPLAERSEPGKIASAVWVMVELSGIEPLTSSLRTTRSPN